MAAASTRFWRASPEPAPLQVAMPSAARQRGRCMVPVMTRYLALAFLLAALPAQAGLDDYQRARDALERHEVLPLARIIEIVEAEIDARMIEVEFEEEAGQYYYELELITADGRLLEARADAVTGRVLAVEEEDED